MNEWPATFSNNVDFLHLLCCFSFQATRINILRETCEDNFSSGTPNRWARIQSDKSNKLVLRRKTPWTYLDMINKLVSSKHRCDSVLLVSFFGRMQFHIRRLAFLPNLQEAFPRLFVFLPVSWFEYALVHHSLSRRLLDFSAIAFDNPAEEMKW